MIRTEPEEALGTVSPQTPDNSPDSREERRALRRARAGERIRRFEESAQNSRRMLVFCLLSVCVFGLAAHAYGFLNGNFSHDVLNALYADAGEEAWKRTLGRIFVPPYRAVTRGGLALPWLIGLLSLVYVGVAAFLVVKTFRVENKLTAALICGVMVTNVTFTAVTATYIYELDFDMLAMLLAAAAAFLWEKWRHPLSILPGAVLIMLSIGLYQSYLSVAVTVMLICSVLALMNGDGFKKVMLHGLQGIVTLGAGGALYAVACEISTAVTGIALTRRTNVFLGEGVNYLKLFGESYQNFFQKIWNTSLLPKALIGTINVLGLAVIGFAVLYTLFLNRRMTVPAKILMAVLLLLVPFAMNLTYVLARGYIHDLMLYGIWFAYILVLLFASRICGEGGISRGIRKAVRWASVACVSILLVSNIVVSNTAYLKKDLEQKSTLSLMTRVVSRMEDREDYLPGQTPVCFIGNSPLYQTIPGFENVADVTGLGWNNAIAQDSPYWYYNTYKAYFRYVLNTPVTICTDEQHNELMARDEVRAMPAYPAGDCMAMVDGVLVVKMG